MWGLSIERGAGSLGPNIVYIELESEHGKLEGMRKALEPVACICRL